MRRRLRERKRVREARLLDLGALVYELHRQGKRAPELLQEKAAELALVDEEVREIEATLEGGSQAPPFNGTAAAEVETHEADALDEPEPEPDDDLGEPLEGEEQRA